jgi:hypothetical protein
MRIWKIGAPIEREKKLWWPVFERYDDGRPDSLPIAYCSGPLQRYCRKGRYSSQAAHDFIATLER